VTKKKPLLENVVVLLVIGVLAGAVGGLGIGLIQWRTMQAASSAAQAGAPTK
jgi:type II secretory pathway pseudopilin PulG